MNYFSFDVESEGLLGSPFAVGWVIVDSDGNEIRDGYLACEMAGEAPLSDIEWVEQNVLPVLPRFSSTDSYYNCSDIEEVLRLFWKAWRDAKQEFGDITMVTDCMFPVEAWFLQLALSENNCKMEDSPYPVLDVASVIAACGGDPIATLPRKPEELPAHNPVNDARQSVRIMLGIMGEISRDRGLAVAHGYYGELWVLPSGDYVIAKERPPGAKRPDPPTVEIVETNDVGAPTTTYTNDAEDRDE